MIRVRVTVLALLLATTISSCSAGQQPIAPTTSPPPPSPTAPVSSERLVAAGLTDDARGPGIDDALGVVPCATTATDRYGTYVPTCLRGDAPVLQFDPNGENGWLLRDGHDGLTLPLDAGYVASAVDSAGRLLIELIDSTAQWDDSADAWAGIRATMDDVLGVGAADMRTTIAARQQIVGMFDVDDWRETEGIRPAPYPSDVPRIRLLDLSVTGMSESGTDPITRDNVGVDVTVRATYTQPVLTSDGTTWELNQTVELSVRSSEATGAVGDFDWSEDHTLGRRLSAGQSSLPKLDTPRAVPTGWTPQVLGRLSFALPGAAVLSNQHDPTLAGTPWKRFTLDAENAYVDVSGPNYRTDPSPEGSWYVVPGFDNYGLSVPGASHAAAEVGRDELGRFRARVDVEGIERNNAASYHLEWDTTPERATEDLRRIVGTLSFATDASS